MDSAVPILGNGENAEDAENVHETFLCDLCVSAFKISCLPEETFRRSQETNENLKSIGLYDPNTWKRREDS